MLILPVIFAIFTPPGADAHGAMVNTTSLFNISIAQISWNIVTTTVAGASLVKECCGSLTALVAPHRTSKHASYHWWESSHTMLVRKQHSWDSNRRR
jgi:hypothetical protein